MSTGTTGLTGYTEYSLQVLPDSIQNKSLLAKQAFLSSYKASLEKGLTHDECVFTGTLAANTADKSKMPSKALKSTLAALKPRVPAHLQVLLEKRSEVVLEAPTAVPVKESFHRAFLGKNAVTADPDRSLVSASWDKDARLQLQFDDGVKIVTEPVPVSEHIEQHIAVSSNPIVPYLQFDTTANVPSAVGQLSWNQTDGTLDLGLGGGNVTLQLGQEQLTHVYNNTNAAFTDLQVLRITGSQGQRLTGALAQANSEANSASTYAVVTEPIPKNQVGFANTFGLVRNVNTSAFPEGSALYLSPTVAGAITATKPTAPNHTVMIGWCIRQHAVQGSIYVHVQNGFELEEIHNVLLTNVQNGHILKYEAASGLWKNANPAAASGVTTSSSFQRINLVANTPFTLTHGLSLVDKDAFTINTLWNNKVVNIDVTSLTVNTLELKSAVSITDLACTVIGVIA